jgi:hypothetical protein
MTRFGSQRHKKKRIMSKLIRYGLSVSRVISYCAHNSPVLFPILRPVNSSLIIQTYFNIILPANILKKEITTPRQSGRKGVYFSALLQIVALMCVAIAVSEAGVIAGYGAAGIGHAGLGYGVAGLGPAGLGYGVAGIGPAGLGYGVAGLGNAGVAYGVAPVAAVAPVASVAHVAPAVAAVAAPHAAVDYYVSVAQLG